MPNPIDLSNTGVTPADGNASQGGQGWIQRSGNTRRNPWGGGLTLEGGGYTGAVGGIDPVDVRNPTPDWGNFNQFGDATYQAATRQLDPQWQQREAQFRQQMVNQGLSEGTEAYNQAWDQFSRSRNDSYTQARTQSLADALAAQQQAWAQNAHESDLANALAQSRMSADASITGANIGAGASMYGADIGRANFLDNLGFQRDQADFGNMMSLYGFDQGVNSYNNGLLQNDRNATLPWLQMIPGVNPSQIDVQGPMNNAYNGQMAAWQSDQARSQAQQQQYMALIGALFCSETFKDVRETVEPSALLDVANAVPVKEWNYKGDHTSHVSPIAEDFNIALHGEPRKLIAMQDVVGVMFGAVQALTAKIDGVIERLNALEVRNAN